ncbi:MAG TPA: FAD-dependent oxidoreductase, partial [Burkholderiaceae bacterium]|nr:FAD-dependent oxidoreductase [Burkholderiaceae bacterium]
MNHVILGAGPAGVIAAETLCKHAPADSVTLIGDEPEPPYSRMAIPYLLSGKIQEDGTHLRHGADHYKKLGIVIERGRAKQVDTAKREVVLEDGRRVGFDRLLIATGASPIKLPIAGLEGPGVQPCWTLADARAIQAQAKSGSRVLLMGAGFIGCIILDPLFARGVKLTVVEMGDRMVPRMMGPIAGSMIKQRCEAKGVTVVTGAKVEAIERAAKDGAEPGLLGKLARAVGLGGGVASAAPMAVRLSNGQKFEVDLVISATGVRPNIGFLENSGIKCLVGVLTDEHLQTNVPGVYAAGDCAEAFDKVSGKTIVSAIQPNAA